MEEVGTLSTFSELNQASFGISCFIVNIFCICFLLESHVLVKCKDTDPYFKCLVLFCSPTVKQCLV